MQIERINRDMDKPRLKKGRNMFINRYTKVATQGEEKHCLQKRNNRSIKESWSEYQSSTLMIQIQGDLA